MRVNATDVFESARKVLVTTEWSITNSDDTHTATDVLLAMVVACGVTSSTAPPGPSLTAATGVTSTTALTTFSFTFFRLVERATSIILGTDAPIRTGKEVEAKRKAVEIDTHSSQWAESALPPVTDPLWRRPALLAALELLADMVWDCQEAVHAHANTSATTTSSSAASSPSGHSETVGRRVVCPLCLAVATASTVAVEALCALLRYHIYLQTNPNDGASNTDHHHDMIRRARTHLDALVRTAVWNGHAKLTAHLTRVWCRQSSLWHVSLSAHQRLRWFSLYVQDESTVAQCAAAMAPRTEDEILASLRALHSVCEDAPQRAQLAQWCLSVPLVWLRDDEDEEKDGEEREDSEDGPAERVDGAPVRKATDAPVKSRPDAPSLTLLAWLIRCRRDAAVRLLLSWLLIAVNPDLGTKTATAEKTAQAHTEAGGRPADPSTTDLASAPQEAPMRVDFHQLAAAPHSATPTPNASSSPAAPDRQPHARGQRVDGEEPSRDLHTYATAAHDVLLLLHGVAFDVSTPTSPPRASSSPTSGAAARHVVSALDMAVRTGQGSLVRLLMAAGASCTGVHPSALEALFATHQASARLMEREAAPQVGTEEDGTCDNRVDFVRLLRAPAMSDGGSGAGPLPLPQQLRRCLYTSSKSALLASVAAKLWQQKVSLVQAPSTLDGLDGSRSPGSPSPWTTYMLAHDRVLRPSLAALEFDPFEPLARLTLIRVLTRKLSDAVPLLPVLWRVCGEDDEEVACTARAWLVYYGAVLRMLLTLTETVRGREALMNAVQSRRLLDGYLAQAQEARVQRQYPGANTSAETSADTSAATVATDTTTTELFATTTAEARAVLARVVRTASQRHLCHEHVVAAITPKAQVVRDAGGDCFVSVHCGARFLAGTTTVGAGAFLRPHAHSRELDSEVWVRVPRMIDLTASLARTGGCFGVVVHAMPLESPFERGDLVLFVLRAAGPDAHPSEGEDGLWSRLEAVQRVSCDERHHPRSLLVPCVLTPSARKEKEKGDDDTPMEVVTLQLVCVGQSLDLAAEPPVLRTARTRDPMMWLDARQSATMPDTTTAQLPSVPSDVIWGMRTSPELTARWQQASLVRRSPPTWIYTVTVTDVQACASLMKGTRAHDWFTCDARSNRSRPLFTGAHQLGRPLFAPACTDGEEPAGIVYVLESKGGTDDGQKLAPRVVGILPE